MRSRATRDARPATGAESVSCVVPVHNDARYLREALDSILAQTHPVAEVLVVDDGSTDGSAAVAGSYGPPVRVLRRPREGPAAARNAGVAAAIGAFIAFLDADDLWHAEKLARQIQRFRSRPELQLCVTHVQPFRDGAAPGARVFEGVPLPGYVFQTLLARREVFDRLGALDRRYQVSEDTEWFMRARDAGVESELLPDALVYRRTRADSYSRPRARQRDQALLNIVKAHLDRRRS